MEFWVSLWLQFFLKTSVSPKRNNNFGSKRRNNNYFNWSPDFWAEEYILFALTRVQKIKRVWEIVPLKKRTVNNIWEMGRPQSVRNFGPSPLIVKWNHFSIPEHFFLLVEIYMNIRLQSFTLYVLYARLFSW